MQADKFLSLRTKILGVDLMGSDTPPQELFSAAVQARETLGPEWKITAFLSQSVADQLPKQASISFAIADEVITMEDEPLSAVRRKKNSSIVLGMRQLKKKAIDAFVSLGNTGALLAAAAINLPLLPGIKRPALLATLPAALGRISILDVGGNLQCQASHLFRFALMGACFERVHFGVLDPKVALLNVGLESKKGREEHRLAYQMLQETSSIHFIGNIEGFEVFQGRAHVVVTDGFTGNVLLKSAEGIAEYLLKEIANKELEQRFSIDMHPGALLLGVKGVVVKCHGRSSAKALLSGMQAAASYVEQGLIPHLERELEPF